MAATARSVAAVLPPPPCAFQESDHGYRRCTIGLPAMCALAPETQIAARPAMLTQVGGGGRPRPGPGARFGRRAGPGRAMSPRRRAGQRAAEKANIGGRWTEGM